MCDKYIQLFNHYLFLFPFKMKTYIIDIENSETLLVHEYLIKPTATEPGATFRHLDLRNSSSVSVVNPKWRDLMFRLECNVLCLARHFTFGSCNFVSSNLFYRRWWIYKRLYTSFCTSGIGFAGRGMYWTINGTRNIALSKSLEKKKNIFPSPQIERLCSHRPKQSENQSCTFLRAWHIS